MEVTVFLWYRVVWWVGTDVSGEAAATRSLARKLRKGRSNGEKMKHRRNCITKQHRDLKVKNNYHQRIRSSCVWGKRRKDDVTWNLPSPGVTNRYILAEVQSVYTKPRSR
jgi:hypothetical protein